MVTLSVPRVLGHCHGDLSPSTRGLGPCLCRLRLQSDSQTPANVARRLSL